MQPPRPAAGSLEIYLPLYIGVGLVLLGIGGYAALSLRYVDDALVLVDQPVPHTGAPLAVRVEQPARRAATLKEMQVALVCKEVRRIRIDLAPVEQEKKHLELKQSALLGHRAGAGELIVADFAFSIPADAPPSTSPGVRAKVRYRWELTLATRIRGWLPYPDKFALTVEAGEPPEEAETAEFVEAEIVDA